VTGQVTAIFQATLSSKIQGTIEKVLVREGVSVTRARSWLL
jgi:multidrug efflux pump subunit AcrA (membrane-fusion protein)